MNNPVPVSLKNRPDIALRLFPFTSLRAVGKCGVFAQHFMLSSFQHDPNIFHKFPVPLSAKLCGTVLFTGPVLRADSRFHRFRRVRGTASYRSRYFLYSTGKRNFLFSVPQSAEKNRKKAQKTSGILRKQSESPEGVKIFP